MDDEDLGVDDDPSNFCVTEVIEWNDRKPLMILASMMKKMMLARQEGTLRVLRLADETTFAWQKAPQQASSNFDGSVHISPCGQL